MYVPIYATVFHCPGFVFTQLCLPWLTRFLVDYDLVRIYHPDSPVNHSVPPHIAQSRFHAISAAYDVLRGRPTSHPFSGDGELERKRNDFHDLSTAMWKAKQRKRAEALTFGSGLDDKWKDRFMFGLIFLVSPVIPSLYSLLLFSLLGLLPAFNTIIESI